MHALVIGGGVAGCVGAIALRKAGLDVTVAEAYGRDSDGIGAFLTLAGNGIDALAAVDLGEVVGELGFVTPEMVLRDHRGRRLVAFPSAAPRPDGLTVRTLRRSDLYTTLRDEAVRRGAEITYGRRLLDAEGGPHGVVARFDDGTTATADLLVGADGLRSRVRTLLDPQAPPARYVGLLNTGGFARGAEVDGEIGAANFCFGKRCFLGYLVAPDGDVWWFANPPSRRELGREDLAAMGERVWRERLRELFADDGLPVDALLDGTAHVFSGWNTYDVPRVRTWHRDRMVLVGDAAHATSPSAGQGASMAIEDAVVLARCLRDAPDVDTAFAAYERARRERVEAVVAHGKRIGDQKAAGPVGRVVRDHVVMPLMSRMMARRSADPLAWMTGHHVEWAEPAVR